MKEDMRLESPGANFEFSGIVDALRHIVPQKFGPDIGFTFIVHPQSPEQESNIGVRFSCTMDDTNAATLLRVVRGGLLGETAQRLSMPNLGEALAAKLAASPMDENARLDMLLSITTDLTRKLFGDDRGVTLAVHPQRPQEGTHVQVAYMSSFEDVENVQTLFSYLEATVHEDPPEVVPLGEGSKH